MVVCEIQPQCRDGRGIRAIYGPANFDVYDKIDDIWQDSETRELDVVDYKSTARAEPEYSTPDYYRYGLDSKYKKSKRSISGCCGVTVLR